MMLLRWEGGGDRVLSYVGLCCVGGGMVFVVWEMGGE